MDADFVNGVFPFVYKEIENKVLDTEIYRTILGKPNKMAKYKKEKAKKNRKKSRGIKHGRR